MVYCARVTVEMMCILYHKKSSFHVVWGFLLLDILTCRSGSDISDNFSTDFQKPIVTFKMSSFQIYNSSFNSLTVQPFKEEKESSSYKQSDRNTQSTLPTMV